MKRKVPTILLLLFAVFLLITEAVGQPEDYFSKRVKELKKRYDFENWEPETGKVISGLVISKKVIPGLGTLRKVWKDDNYSINRARKDTHVSIRKWWRLEDEQFDVTMVVGPTFEAAKEYLISTYANTQREPPLIKPPGRKFGLKIGNVCFVTAEEEGEAFSSIDFIRHNVLIMIRAEGDVRMKLRAMAETIDALLLKQKPARKYEELRDRPTITAFSAEKKKIKFGENTLLKLEVRNPRDSELRYLWTITGGGVKKNLVGDFVYQGGEKGKHRVTITVVNDVGLYDSKPIDIEVVQP